MLDLARKALFLFSPETAHKIGMRGLTTLNALGVLQKLIPPVPGDPVQVLGLKFPNPIGLGAGFDKNGEYLPELFALGFGFVEAGTVTPRAQSGNPTPRLFRLPEHKALINRMGFNNCGIQQFIRNIGERRGQGILGINIGKNADTPIENAVDDYLIGIRAAYAHADYITVNISSPNTTGLRSLQAKEALTPLVQALVNEQSKLASGTGGKKALLVKIAPDLSEEELEVIGSVLLEAGVDGVIATNTTLDRSKVADHPRAEEKGGLSGEPLTEKSLALVRHLKSIVGDKLPIIGCGGLSSAADAAAMKAAGARLLQVYTAFIYQGPGIVRELADGYSRP